MGQRDAVIIKLIADVAKVPADSVTADASLVDDLNCDSLDLVEIVMKIEDAFDVRVSEEDAKGLKTVSDILAHLETAGS